MTIEELKEVCSKLVDDMESRTDINNAFHDFQKTNKITPKLQWTKVHDIYVTKIHESTLCVGAFAALAGYHLQVSGVYIDALYDIPQEVYKTPQACMDAIEEALN